MPSVLTEEEAELDPYALLELASAALEPAVRKAYRQKSLKYHPDRNPTPEAAIMFRRISLSLEILLSPAKRTYVDTKLESDRLKRQKYSEMDKKRKAMVDALNQREDDAKKARGAQVRRRQEETEEERIKEEGRRMLEAAQSRMKGVVGASTSRANHDSSRPSVHFSSISREAEGDPQPVISPEDLTLVLHFPPSSTASCSSSAIQSTLVARYGRISHVVLKDPPAGAVAEGKKKKAKGKRAMVEFQQGNWGGCWACWRDHSDDGALEGRGKAIESGIRAKWAVGREPDWVAWAERHSRPNTGRANGNHIGGATNGGYSTQPTLDRAADRRRETDGAAPPAPLRQHPTFTSAPDLGGTTMADLLARHESSKDEARAKKAKQDNYESMTLLRMRQMERERLAEQIRRDEEDEDGVVA